MKSHIDPVCSMQVEEQNAAGLSEYEGQTYYFDSEECMKRFNQHPEQYVGKSGREDPNNTVESGGVEKNRC